MVIGKHDELQHDDIKVDDTFLGHAKAIIECTA